MQTCLLTCFFFFKKEDPSLNVLFLHPELSPNSLHPRHTSDGSQSVLTLVPGFESRYFWLIDAQSPQVLPVGLCCAGRIMLTLGLRGVDAGSVSALTEFKISQGRKI